MEKYLEYLQQAKKWCDELLRMPQEAGQMVLIERWKAKINEINDRLAKDLERDEVLEIDRELQALNEEWQHFYREMYDKPKEAGEEEREEASTAVPIGGHKLPRLPYAYDALEPYIDETTMRLHYQKHHQSYVDGLNKAEKELAKARRANDFALVKHWERELAFNGAGHYLHSIFWRIMNPRGGGKPTGELEREINRTFGGFSAFKEHFSKAAENVEGGGWAILVWSPQAGRLEVLQAEKHQNLSQWDVVPLLALDVWEHAYYLKYHNKRADYIKNWWNVVHWEEVNRRLREAKRRERVEDLKQSEDSK